MTLESYLADGILPDRADIGTIESVLHDIASTIAATFVDKYWPYEVQRGGRPKVRGFSHSTTAMMIHSIDLLLGSDTNQIKKGYVFDLGKKSELLLKQKQLAISHLFEDIVGDESSSPCVKSKTYGNNDPLTSSFIADVLRHTDDIRKENIKELILSKFQDRGSFNPADKPEKFFNKIKVATPLANAFIPLRYLRTCDILEIEPPVGRQVLLRYFESTLHDQLSFSSIPDSRFDPAELAFCLEGMLLASSDSVDVTLFSRVLEVLTQAQKSSAHWRPTKPFLRNERGMVLFPLSVEAANALLQSCRIVDADSRFNRFTGDVIGLLRRFWEWLSARQTSFALQDGTEVAGWHSDHVADINVIQLWDTAQVVEFLLGYRARLYLHIARTTLQLSRFDVRQPISPVGPWSEDSRPLQPWVEQEKPDDGSGASTTVVEQFEPVTSLGENYFTYQRIGNDFVLGWLEGKRENYSMLLYGPPGTGKTSVAENIADALQFPLITITVSDFLAEGGAAVEARAKTIFQVLEAQADCVVLLDELDELLLDRSSARHGKQDTVFKFMTPGMLTKLNNLRRKNRIIFILATNYAFRIDPAIKRTGRIDENYLLLPPDSNSRRRMLLSFLEKKFKNAADKLCPTNVHSDDLDRLAKTSHFLGYKDIEAAVARVARGKQQDVEKLNNTLQDWPRTTSLDFYRSSFAVLQSTEMQDIKKEFLPLVRMAMSDDPDKPLPTDILDLREECVFAHDGEMMNAAIDETGVPV